MKVSWVPPIETQPCYNQRDNSLKANSEKENSGQRSPGTIIPGKGLNFVMVNREDGRENRRRGGILQPQQSQYYNYASQIPQSNPVPNSQSPIKPFASTGFSNRNCSATTMTQKEGRVVLADEIYNTPIGKLQTSTMNENSTSNRKSEIVRE